MKPPHLAINDEVSKEAVSKLRIFSMQESKAFCTEGRCPSCAENVAINGGVLTQRHFRA